MYKAYVNDMEKFWYIIILMSNAGEHHYVVTS
jgi:hypothetical protein